MLVPSSYLPAPPLPLPPPVLPSSSEVSAAGGQLGAAVEEYSHHHQGPSPVTVSCCTRAPSHPHQHQANSALPAAGGVPYLQHPPSSSASSSSSAMYATKRRRRNVKPYEHTTVLIGWKLPHNLLDLIFCSNHKFSSKH